MAGAQYSNGCDLQKIGAWEPPAAFSFGLLAEWKGASLEN
jgi:hypothetical protein